MTAIFFANGKYFMIIPELYWLVAAFLLFNLLLGLIRVYAGGGRANRLLAVQLFGTTTAAILVLLAEAITLPSLRDVALLLTLFTALLSVAFVRFSPHIEEDARQ
jgi:multicomponent Na+:H+ antiporter subunit F